MPNAAMTGAIFFWSSALIANKVLLDHLAISELLVIRLVFGAVLLWLLVMLARAPLSLRRFDKRPLLMGLLEPGLVSLFVVWGQSLTSAVNTAVMWSLLPIVMPVLGRVILKERIRAIYLVAAALAVAGTALLVADQAALGQGSLKGDLLVAAGVMCAAANQLIARRVALSRARPELTSALQITAAGVLAFAVFALIERPEPAFHAQTAPTYAWMTYVGIAGSAGPFLLYNYALRYLPVGRISLYGPLVGPMGGLLAWLILGESITGSNIAAIAVVLLAAFLPMIVDRLRPAPSD